MQSTELITQWDDFRDPDKYTITACFAIKHGLTKKQASALVTVFNITNPGIILGKANGQSYVRLADTSQDNKDVLTLLINTYVL